MRIVLIALVLACAAPAFGGASKWFPIEIENGQIFLPITLNGEAAHALIDTGSTSNAISQAFLDSHEGGYTRGKVIRMTGINGEYDTNMINGVQLGLFGMEFGVDQLTPVYSDGFEFILGVPFFNLFVVQIDYPGRQMRVIDRESIDMRKFSNVKMKHSTNSPRALVRVDMNGEYKPWLLLDTGNNAGILMQRFRAEKLGWLESYAAERSSLTGIADEVAAIDVFTIPAMTIGPFEMEDVEVMVPGPGQELNLRDRGSEEWQTGTRIKRGKASDGILGYDILQHFIVTFDHKRALLNLDVPR